MVGMTIVMVPLAASCMVVRCYDADGSPDSFHYSLAAACKVQARNIMVAQDTHSAAYRVKLLVCWPCSLNRLRVKLHNGTRRQLLKG